MVNRKTLLLATLMLLNGKAAPAMDMTDALVRAYQSNPALAAAQARLRAVDTSLAEAQSGWRPSADLLANAGVGRTRFDGDTTNTRYPRDLTLSLSQPIWRGGATEAGIDRAEAEIRAERARLIVTEQSVLLEAATAYLDVQRDEAIAALERDNVARLQQQLTASHKRFEAGELTVTDVRQAEARLGGARADAATAEANLAISNASFRRVTGTAPVNLAEPQLALNLPASLDDALKQASGNDPRIAAATYSHDAARETIDVARAALRPNIALKLDMTRSWAGTAIATGGREVDDARVVGSIVVPLYRAGADYARLAGARETATARVHELQESRNQSEAQVIAAWSGLAAAQSSVTARRGQAQATGAALEGVQIENQVGTRSVLDVLDAQNELRNAKVGEAQSQRDMAVAQLQLAATGGQLTARALQLPVKLYDPGEHFREIDGNWFPGQ